MYEVKEHSKEKVILVTVSLHKERLKGWEAEDVAKELKELALSTGVNVIDELICNRDEFTPNYLIGKGKTEEIRELIDSHKEGVEAVIFSENLSSTQQRNLEEVFGIKTIDRTQLILDLFAQRAHTNEGKLQVELAQLEYKLPRLAGLGIKLSRLGGGIGTRGPGEKMLETDRRAVERRIKYVKFYLEDLKRRRAKLRQNRIDHSVATIAIVGYTNAGKSTFLNGLTKANITADNRLFCTLDPTSRRYILPNSQKALFIDTVGFIHNLPHNLIEAFKATLEEVKEADLLLHIMDISSPRADEQFDAVYEVLKELGAYEKPIVTALNKVDKVDNRYIIERFRNKVTESAPISALKQTGFEGLIQLIMENLNSIIETVEIVIPYSKMALLNTIYEEGKVVEREDAPDGIHIKATISTRLKSRLNL